MLRLFFVSNCKGWNLNLFRIKPIFASLFGNVTQCIDEISRKVANSENHYLE